MDLSVHTRVSFPIHLNDVRSTFIFGQIKLSLSKCFRLFYGARRRKFGAVALIDDVQVG